ncbi:MAG: hypothetical protein KDE19_11845 [Caldilineaceae bacterium]|nr:hypothetical protein [Caldilineaceae bacterium]
MAKQAEQEGQPGERLDGEGSAQAPSVDLSGNVTGSAEKVERIRDILFGTQMRDYTQRFDAVTRDLARVSQEVAQLSEQLKEQENRLRKELRQESDRLLSQLQEQDAARQQQIQKLDQRLSEQLQTLDQKHTESAQTLAHHLANVEQMLRAELHELSTHLNHAKVDRPSLGELLINLGASLQANAPKPLEIKGDLLDQLNEELF